MTFIYNYVYMPSPRPPTPVYKCQIYRIHKHVYIYVYMIYMLNAMCNTQCIVWYVLNIIEHKGDYFTGTQNASP